MKRRQQTPAVVIGLARDLGSSRGSGSTGGAVLGAGDPALRRSRTTRACVADWPALAHAIAEISTPPLRNMGTIGGNLLLDTRCNYYDQNLEWRQAIDFCMKKDGEICWVAPGSPKCLAVQSADSVPVLIALRSARAARVGRGDREVAVEDLYRNDGIDYLTKRPDELLTEILVPAADGMAVDLPQAAATRCRSIFPSCPSGAAVRLDGGRVAEARLVLGGVASAPLRLSAAEAVLAGTCPRRGRDPRSGGRVAAGPSRPMDNTDFSFLWRKEMTKRYVDAPSATWPGLLTVVLKEAESVRVRRRAGRPILRFRRAILLSCTPSRIARLSRTHLAPQKSDESNGKSEASSGATDPNN